MQPHPQIVSAPVPYPFLSSTIQIFRSVCFSVGSSINEKESSLIPTLRLENLDNVVTEYFSLLQGKSGGSVNALDQLAVGGSSERHC